MNTATLSGSAPVDTRAERSSEVDEALEWVGRYGEIGAWRSLTRRPWAHTLELEFEGSAAYLKLLPPALKPALESTTLLARHFSGVLPAVLASEPTRGWLLIETHGGDALSRQASEAERCSLLAVYAELQSRATALAELLGCLPAVDLDAQIAQLRAFLDPDGPLPAIEGARVHADEFLSRSRCRDYAGLLALRAPLLEACISGAGSLPQTVNHGDLRPANAARRADGSIVLFDWEEATAGPAGMSLHALFSGCAPLLAILNDADDELDPESLRQPRRELMHYLTTLADAGYTDHQSLKRCLAGAALAGMVQYLVSFSRYPHDSERYRSTVRGNLKKRFSDLLDVSDMLALENPACVLALAQDYQAHQRERRAERLLRRHLRRQPNDADAALELGRQLLTRARYRRALEVLTEAQDIRPRHAPTAALMAEACRGLGDYRRAVRHFHRAIAHLPATDAAGRSATGAALSRTQELARMERDAARPGLMPELRYTRSERAEATVEKPTVELGDTLFRRYGVLALRSVFDPELLADCHTAFTERYQAYLANRRHADALRIGDKRFQITIDIRPPYDAPALLAHPLLMPLMHRLLGQSCILGCFTSAMSLPGSLDQRLHKDHKALFDADPEATATPSFAVTLMIPLVPLDERVGTTRVKKGSHRLSSRESADLPWQTPLLELGDAYLMDYRLSHHGQANRSSRPRPILSLVYQRPWFRDYINFQQQPPLRIDSTHFEGLPAQLKTLLDWTQQPLPRT